MSGWELRFRDPRRAWLARLGIGALLLSVPLAFFGGRWSTGADNARSEAEAQRQEALIGEQKTELERLRTEVEVLRSGERLGQQAIEQSRQTIKLLEEQVFKQQQDIAFYKGVVAPASKTDALEIRAFEVQGTDNPLRFRYKVMLSRLGKDERKLDGRLKVRISGKLARKDTSYDLEQLSPELGKTGLSISLRHFQSIPEAGRFAELELPKNFIPTLIDVRAELNGQSKPLQRRFDWPKQ
ncbi:TPA: hypothetical protein L6B08_03015 [Pseudomonas aeruginosa]|uniref:Transmembrane protein n=2 Tax=Pseudomonas aeruginosa group TaxID=136841 RepID=A0ABD7K9F4_PSEAI|nr:MULTISPECIES: DUF6776 family protein [Pseudomonas aeruginosa group]KFF36282.1 hypothetical protein G039_0303135 [Pseudomonas aeruginosa VRFPA01]ABR84972.1 hypothetical protein PSPA7_0804 [Pseudomonas aeruginosa PA7]KSC87556.1 hypothetical protein AO896_19130 [Pseudomonas aeruginosa]KSD18193.1 hypothetical protein AO898_16925 [Pseudomonas aeruginosa]KSG50960.1 hypothetical protein AO955_10315 [Pseudomonas aeruginosa]